METLVKRKDMVVVYGTGANKNMPQSKKYKVHSIVAEKLIEKGFASRTSTGEGTKPKGKGKE